MGFLDQIFGTSLPVAVRFLIAFGIVLGLIALTAWAVRRLAGRRLPVSNQGRARQPRLGVLDAFAIDARRRLVLIRRDNVEHLIMIGGPNDLVVESNIVRTPSQGVPAPQQRTSRAPDVETGRPLAPSAGEPPMAQGAAPQVPPAVQSRAAAPPNRPAAAPPVVRTPMPAAPSPAPEPQPAPAAQAAPEPPPSRMPGFFRSTVNRQAGAAPVTPPPAPRAPPREALASAPQPSPAKPDVDPLFADIEKRLEQALHQRPAAAPAPATPPSPAPAAPAAGAPPAPPSAASRPSPLPPRRPLPERPPIAPRAMPERDAPRPVPTNADVERAPAPSATKATLDALEEEMASLLGRDRQP